MNTRLRLISVLVVLSLALSGVSCFTEPSGSTGATSAPTATPTPPATPNVTPESPSPTPTTPDPTPSASPTTEAGTQPTPTPSSSTAPPPGSQPTPQAKAASGGIPTDTRVVVNTPAFRMDIFEDGKLTKSYKIGIGYPEFPLPTALRKAETIIFSPTWTPPDEPWVESSSKVKVGQKIEAGDKLNPLGLIKIPIGLPSLIHGGKSPAQIGRFASHGCVGLTNAQVHDVAKQLARISGTQISEEQIAEYEKNKTETKPVKLTRPIPVELRYETISVEDGKLHIYRDVYARGTNTEENLRKVLQTYSVNLEDLSESTRAQAMRALSQMGRDANGQPVMDGADVGNGGPSAKSPKPKSEQEKKAAGRVTRTIRGATEVAIEIPALAGKGYPAPSDLDTGSPPKKAAPSRARRKK